MSTESLETRVAALEAASTEVIVRLDALDRTTRILTQDVANLRNQGIEPAKPSTAICASSRHTRFG